MGLTDDDIQRTVEPCPLGDRSNGRGGSHGVRIDTVFAFEPVPSGTKVSVKFELNSQGLPRGLLSPLEWAIGGKVRHVLSDDLDDLKRSIEQVTAG